MRQKDVPRELLIGDLLWSIKFKRLINGDPLLLGLCDPEDNTIYIKQGQTFIERADSVAHEVTHAICFSYNFEIKHAHVYKLGHAFARLLVDNF